MTELPPDIPPWSPLADRSRNDDRRADDAGTVSSDSSGTLLTREGDAPPPGSSDAPGFPRRRRTLLLGLVAGVLSGLVLALALVSTLGGDDTEPPPTTTVRSPLPTTSPEEPAPLGTRVALGNGWTVVVRAFDPDATRKLGPRKADAPPLEEGQVIVLVDLEMTYVDGLPDAESPFFGVDLALREADRTVTTPPDTPCTAPAPTFDMATELERGQAESGRICFAVDGDQVASLVLVATPSMTFGATPSHLSLRTAE